MFAPSQTKRQSQSQKLSEWDHVRVNGQGVWYYTRSEQAVALQVEHLAAVGFGHAHVANQHRELCSIDGRTPVAKSPD